MFDLFLDAFKRSLFTISSVILFFSYALFFLLHNLSNNSPSLEWIIQLIPIIIGSTLSFIALVTYFFWRRKQYMLIKMHMQKNYINYDTIAVTLIFFAILALFVITILFLQIKNVDPTIQIIVLVVYGIFLLIPQGFHKFFIYKVKIELTKRKNGGELSYDPKKLENNNSHLDSKKMEKRKLPPLEIKNLKDKRESSAGKFYE